MENFEFINNSQAQSFIQECYQFFQLKKLELLHKPIPTKQRTCTDIPFAILFFFIVGSYIIYSIYSMNRMFDLGDLKLGDTEDVTFLKDVSEEQFQLFIVTVSYCIAISVGLAIILLVLLKFFTEKTALGMALTTILIPLGLTLYSFAEESSDIGYCFAVVTIGGGAFIIAQKDKITKLSILLHTVIRFIIQNPKILFVIILTLIYSLMILFFWVMGFYSFCVLYSNEQMTFPGFVLSMTFWVYILYFFNSYFHYTNIFLTSNGLLIWFYNKIDEKTKVDVITTPFKFMVLHLGTITFITIVGIWNKILWLLLLLPNIPKIGCIFKKILCCCLGKMQVLTLLINDYSIIVCGVTGYNLVDSSKLLGQIILKDGQDVFITFSFIIFLISLGGYMIVWLLPSFIGGLILYDLEKSLWALTIILILFTCSMTGSLFLSLLIQAMKSLFLMFHIDGILTEKGVQVEWYADLYEQLSKSLDQAFVNKIKSYKIKTINRTTIVIHQNGVHEIFKEKIHQRVEQKSSQELMTPEQMTKKIKIKQKFNDTPHPGAITSSYV